ncbi:MAG: baseplate J/gp47 family protein, partial [Burkholderiales bacterium]|nr:baseplate J/gp47 family protein [Burkholderiales bacterium]
ATQGAVAYAIAQVLPSASYYIAQNVSYAGAVQLGYFYVVVDDGSGNPPPSFLSSVAAAIDAVRPLSVSFNVYPPVLQPANFSATIGIASGYDPVATRAAVSNAVTNYVGSLPLGASLPYSKLIQVAWEASPGVANVSAALLNGGTADIAGNVRQSIRAGAITLS